MTELTQTQERKLWASIVNGNEHAIKWNEILTTFASLGLDRQKIALKRMPLDKFLLVKDLVERVYKSRESEIAKLEARRKDVNEVKELMKKLGVSSDELHGASPKPKEKRKFGATVSDDRFLNTMYDMGTDGIFKKKNIELAEELGMSLSGVYKKLTALVKSGKLVNLGRSAGYQVIRGG